MIAYIDSSTLLRYVIRAETSIFQAFALGRCVSSELLEIESRRTLLRYRAEGSFDDAQLDEAMTILSRTIESIDLIELDSSIKRRAMEAFPISVKTLDALHLATCLAVRHSETEEALLVFSHDLAMNRAARLLGFATPLSTPSG